MYFLIYKTTNLINGKFYIGMHKTKNKDDGYMGSGKLLKFAIAKYGIENFNTEILLECNSEEEMKLAEKILVVTDNEVCYNLCSGGKGGFGYINQTGLKYKHLFHTEKTKEKIRKSISTSDKRKHMFTDDVRLKISKAKQGNSFFGGRHHTDDTKEKMRKAKENYVPWNKGKKGVQVHSLETRQKMSESHKLRLCTAIKLQNTANV